MRAVKSVLSVCFVEGVRQKARWWLSLPALCASVDVEEQILQTFQSYRTRTHNSPALFVFVLSYSASSIILISHSFIDMAQHTHDMTCCSPPPSASHAHPSVPSFAQRETPPPPSSLPSTFTCTFCHHAFPGPARVLGRSSARLTCASCYAALLDISIC